MTQSVIGTDKTRPRPTCHATAALGCNMSVELLKQNDESTRLAVSLKICRYEREAYLVTPPRAVSVNRGKPLFSHERIAQQEHEGANINKAVPLGGCGAAIDGRRPVAMVVVAGGRWWW